MLPLNLLSKDGSIFFRLLTLLKKCSFLRRAGTIRVKSGYSKIHLPDIIDSRCQFVKRTYGDSLVIKIRYPGLGDHLFYSKLPELLIESNLYKKIYISDESKYRFDGIKELVWGSNPYVSGFCKSDGWTYSGIRPENGNFVDGIEILFKGDDSIRGRSPKLYLNKNQRLKNSVLEGKIYVDLSSFSNQDTPSFETIVAYLKKYKKSSILITEPRNYLGKVFNEFEKIALPNSIFEYCNYLLSCEKYYCLYSGGNSLAPAIDVQANVFIKKIDLAQSYTKNNYILID